MCPVLARRMPGSGRGGKKRNRSCRKQPVHPDCPHRGRHPDCPHRGWEFLGSGIKTTPWMQSRSLHSTEVTRLQSSDVLLPGRLHMGVFVLMGRSGKTTVHGGNAQVHSAKCKCKPPAPWGMRSCVRWKAFSQTSVVWCGSVQGPAKDRSQRLHVVTSCSWSALMAMQRGGLWRGHNSTLWPLMPSRWTYQHRCKFRSVQRSPPDVSGMMGVTGTSSSSHHLVRLLQRWLGWKRQATVTLGSGNGATRSTNCMQPRPWRTCTSQSPWTGSEWDTFDQAVAPMPIPLLSYTWSFTTQDSWLCSLKRRLELRDNSRLITHNSYDCGLTIDQAVMPMRATARTIMGRWMTAVTATALVTLAKTSPSTMTWARYLKWWPWCNRATATPSRPGNSHQTGQPRHREKLHGCPPRSLHTPEMQAHRVPRVNKMPRCLELNLAGTLAGSRLYGCAQIDNDSTTIPWWFYELIII